ncbi:MAG: glycine cleavage system aminomethyltransferase GcvT [Planctomycetota bacterium]|nr:glycine cleavage system aminomethyltransferase GcvT [Planctomycetota bacterium]
MTNQTALYHVQCSAGAKMVDFHGWMMPVQFAGISAEHRTVRSNCGVFDLGHMGRLRVSGAGTLAFLQRVCTRPLGSLADGQVRYSLVCADDGTVEDDILVSRESGESYHVVVNASNKGKILELWQPLVGDDANLTDLTDEQAMFAVQGPAAAELLATLGLDGRELKYYRFKDIALDGISVRLSRTGYTGEDGFELFCPSTAVADLWQRVVDAGGVPCGLGARDTLRLEAGMPLYGNELDRAHTPVEAGLAFAVGMKGNYTGATVLQQQAEAGTARKLVGLQVLGKRPPRHGYPVLNGDDVVGEVTSGAPSPTLGHGIAMAYVPSELSAIGTQLSIDIRGRSREAATVVPLPFYRRK